MGEIALWQIAVLLAAAAVAAPVAKSLKIGSVLGYLAAGLVIGPHILGVFTEPEKILHVAEFGVILLLFIIGLELRLQRLWTMRVAVFGLGGAQVAITAAVITLGLLWTGLDWRVALFCGLALSLSSTAFVLQVLKERGELDDRHGRLAFAVLLFQDIAAIPMIALVGLLAVGGEAMTATGAAWAAVKALAAIALVIVASRFLLTRLYRLIASTGLQEAMVASALLTVVIIGLVMQAAGLSAALGAFVAGVVLADSEYRHEVEANIAPFSGLLLGLFFVAVGMSIDTAALLERPGTIALAVAALVAVKAAVLWPLGQRMGLASPKARRLGLALSQGGEFAFVLASAAVAGNVIEAGTANLLNVVVALSMATTPFLLILDDRIAGRGKREETPSFDEMPKEEGHVVIAGLGRFGQIVARILRARKIPFTALDASPEQVDFVRRFGSKIYYGDASRFEILEAAQTGKARAFVLAIDDVDASLKTAQLVRRHYPHVPIYARARNRTHAHKLMDIGVQELERELFLSSLDLSRRLLRALGLAEAEARRTVNTFGTMDTRRLIDDYRYFTDTEKMRVNAMRQAEELEQLFEADARAIAEAGDGKA